MEQMDFVARPGRKAPARKRSKAVRDGYRRLTADIPEDLHKRLKMQALMDDSTVTDIIIEATRAWLANRR
ncbi:MAG: hypothetical protein P1U64_04820 [Alcanivoracaceae bacterium]|nr:hypothetical protein [Alcanivoracaceae bacterium]